MKAVVWVEPAVARQEVYTQSLGERRSTGNSFYDA
jgi:hypothetical protein